METIRSASNPALKRVRAVAAGREPGVLLLEGDRLVDDALRRGLALELALVADDRPERAAELAAAGVPVRAVRRSLLERASALATSPGVLALAAAPAPLAPGELPREPDALVAVAAGIADPGNLGALARTAEAAGASALVVLRGGASPWSPKALRGSMGSLLRLPVAVCGAEEARDALAAHGFRQLRAATRGGAPYDRLDWSGRVALWLASETGELPLEDADLETVTIPMAGAAESLNVTAAAAVLLFAARRTRAEAPR